jgi:xanthine dehydrogenase accessory factor
MAVLATIVEIVGSAPRSAGTQMVFDDQSRTGYLSGGCLEADLANHAARVLGDGWPVRLRYGQGSPWIDIRLLCGGSLEILLERIAPDDELVGRFLALTAARKPVLWRSDGTLREAQASSARLSFLFHADVYRLSYEPRWRIVVAGGDPITLAIAALGSSAGFEVVLVRPGGPTSGMPLEDVAYVRDPPCVAVRRLGVDRWTAYVSATHDDEVDDAFVLAAFQGDPAYVGVLGSHRRASERRERLFVAGLSQGKVEEVHGPIGMIECGKAPWEVAVSVIAQIMVTREATLRIAESDTEGQIPMSGSLTPPRRRCAASSINKSDSAANR